MRDLWNVDADFKIITPCLMITLEPKVPNIPLQLTNRFFLWLILVGALLTTVGCSPTRKLSEDEFLLVKNQVKNPNKEIDTDDLKSLIRQKPNRKILGFFRFHLQVYNLVDKEKVRIRAQELDAKNEKRNARRIAKGKGPKERRRSFREWLMEIGEEPAVLDTSITEQSRKQLEIYLNSKGYFHGHVSDTTIYGKRKKTKVVYQLDPGIPYLIRGLTYDIDDPKIHRWIIPNNEKSLLIKPGMTYDTDVLQKERERITRSMRSNGFYAFTDDMIRIEADSAFGDRTVDLRLYLRSDTTGAAGEAVQKAFEEYRIGTVYIYSQFDPTVDQGATQDTMIYNGYHLIFDKKFKHRPEVLMSKIFLKTGEIYRVRKAELTYQQLSGLRAFRYVNIAFKERVDPDGYHLLDTYIQLSPGLKQSYGVELQGTNTAGNLGIFGSFVYRNKNLTRGAEILEFKVNAGLESQIVTEGVEGNVIAKGLPFNTLEIGPQINLRIPKFLVPFGSKRLSNYADPNTIFSISYNYQQRPDYTRSIFTGAYGYSWRQNQFKFHELNPFEVNFVNIYNEDPVFTARIDALSDPLLRNSYRPHATTTTNYSFTFSNQRVGKNVDFSYLKVELESAGNVLRGIMSAAKAPQDDQGNYSVFNVPFAQYLKYEIDFRRYFIFNKRSEFVFRIQHGMGYPLENLGVLPFESSFFGGGANSIRGWNARTIGPGSLSENDTANLSDQFGDIKIEVNLEYRFDIYRWFEGAIFADAGNIWLVNEDASRPGGQFKFNSFIREFGVSFGAGLRLDFSFFVIRLDYGIPAYDPAQSQGQRWIIGTPRRKQGVFNLGIGYPF